MYGDNDRLDEEIEFGSPLDALRIRSWRIVAARQHRERGLRANRIGVVMKQRLKGWGRAGVSIERYIEKNGHSIRENACKSNAIYPNGR